MTILRAVLLYLEELLLLLSVHYKGLIGAYIMCHNDSLAIWKLS